MAGEFSGCGKGNYARKRRARRIYVACRKCARMSCDKNPCSLVMVSDNGEDKIQFIRGGLNKESLDDILLSLETHPSKERFSSYGHYSKKSMHDIVSGI